LLDVTVKQGDNLIPVALEMGNFKYYNKLTYHAFEVIKYQSTARDVSSGTAKGGTKRLFTGYGLCPINPPTPVPPTSIPPSTLYSCRFLSKTQPAAHPLRALDSPLVAVPTPRPSAGPSASRPLFQCSTPPWGYHYPEPETNIVLVVGNAANATRRTGASEKILGNLGSVGYDPFASGLTLSSPRRRELVTSVPPAIPFNFTCCVERKVNHTQALSMHTSAIPTIGNTQTSLYIKNWNDPLKFRLSTQGDIKVVLKVPYNNSRVSQGHCTNCKG
jgi:hypothetical protein